MPEIIKPLVLNKEVADIIADMKQFGVLCNLDDHRLDDHRPAAMVSCSDGLYADDLRERHRGLKMKSGLCSQPLLHNLAWHGGALALAHNSPLNSHLCEDEVFFSQVTKAYKLGYTAIPLYAHVPCKAANACNLGFWQLMHTLMAAKTRVKLIGADVVASAFLHIDYGHALDAAWVNREAWVEWAVKRVKMKDIVPIAA